MSRTSELRQLIWKELFEIDDMSCSLSGMKKIRYTKAMNFFSKCFIHNFF